MQAAGTLQAPGGLDSALPERRLESPRPRLHSHHHAHQLHRSVEDAHMLIRKQSYSVQLHLLQRYIKINELNSI